MNMSELEKRAATLAEVISNQIVEIMSEAAQRGQQEQDPQAEEDHVIEHLTVLILCDWKAAWLAANPADDDEPVTDSWLIAIGANSLLEFAINSGFCLKFYRGLNPSIEDLDGNLVELPDCDTRSAVRRLCAALGIPLKETDGFSSKR